MTEEDPNLFPFVDARTDPDKVLEYKGAFDNEDNILVIDNGSYNCRMGWMSSQEGPQLVYKNVLGRTRKEKGKESELVVANDIANIETLR